MDDAISRKSLIDYLQIMPIDLGYREVEEIEEYVRSMPTIEPERKKGKWIEQDDSWDGVYYECSACGEPWTTIDGTHWDNGMKFCPNCGAEMTEGEG